MEDSLMRLRQDVDNLTRALPSEAVARVDRVLAERTRYLALVVEDLYQPHNGGAVIRACERFGVQDLYAIQTRNPFLVSDSVAYDAARWVTVQRAAEPHPDDTARVLGRLKRAGYQVVVTTLRKGAVPLGELDLTRPTALCFGAEEQGLSETAHGLADCDVYLPMYGFTQSFNISVSVALALFELTEKIRRLNLPWQLDEDARLRLKRSWLQSLAGQDHA